MGSLNENSSDKRKLALIIGNDTYSQSINKLDQSAKNAMELVNLLKKIEFQVKTEINIQSEIMKRIQDFVNEFQIKAGDLVLVYFAGHACQYSGKNWLIPTDDSSIADVEDVETFGTDVKGILDRLMDSNSSSCTVVLILDCCRPYKLGNSPTPNSLLENQPRSGVFIQFASAANETANSNLFAKHLLLKINTRNKDVVEVFQDISHDVYIESNHTQEPLSINGLKGLEKVYINRITNLPEIPADAVWQYDAFTVVGGKGRGKTLDRLDSPTDLSIDKNQNIMVADSLNHRIMKYKRSVSGRRIDGKNTDGYGPDMLYRPSSAISDKKRENFIICDSHNRRILERALNDKTFRKKILENINCLGLAMDDDGSLYISDTELHEVRRYLPGERHGTVVAGGNGQGRRLCQLNHPTYICIGRDRSVYVSDSWNDRVMRWDEGAKEGVIVAGGKGKGKDRTQLDHPAGVVVDSLGTVYVADYWNGRVMRWCKGASQGDIIAGDQFLTGDDLHELNGPEGLAFDRYNNLYVADSSNHRIQRFKILNA